MTIRAVLLCALFAVTVTAIPAVHAELSGVQTGPFLAPMYAGGMAYDRSSHMVYLTGSTYLLAGEEAVSSTSNCFVSILRLPDGDTSDVDNNKLQWIQQQVIGTKQSHEACSGLTLAQTPIGDTASSAYIIGTSEESGLLTDLRAPGSDKATQYGTLLNLGFASNGQGRLYGGYLMHGYPVNFPIAAFTDPIDPYVYTVAMTSESNKLSSHYTRDVGSDNEYPNLTRGGATPKFGSGFELLIQRLRVVTTENVNNGDTNQIQTLRSTWREPLATADSSVLVSSMIKRETATGGPLVLAGSARQSSPLIGDQPDNLSDNKWSGFLLLLDASTGKKLISQRYATTDDENVEILGMCAMDDDKAADGYVYIVGATSGIMPDTGATHPPESSQVDAVVAKIEIATLEVLWVKQLRASTTDPNNSDLIETYAHDCAVSNDGKTVYVGGIVEDEMVMEDATSTGTNLGLSNGEDDIWIASFVTESGIMNWMEQVGTDGNDRLAHGGSIIVDQNDNLLIFGDTTGSFYRTRDASEPKGGKHPDQFVSDLFVFTMDPQGNYLMTTEDSGTDGHMEHDAPTQPPIILETAAPVQIPTEAPTATPVAGSDADENLASDTDDSSDDISSSRFHFMTVALVLAIIAAVAACMMAQQTQREKDTVTERGHVFAYLQSFDVEDVDLRHSATGGWHGTYVNNLAHGVNKADPSDMDRLGPEGVVGALESAPLTHSSVVTDSLFMDIDSKPSLGGSSRTDYDSDDDADIRLSGEEDDNSTGYDGLVGAYNESWQDLRPRPSQERKDSLVSDKKPWGKEII